MATRRDGGKSLRLQDLNITEKFAMYAGWSPDDPRPSRHWHDWPSFIEAFESVRTDLLRHHSRPWPPFAEHALDEWRGGNGEPYAAAREQYDSGVADYVRHHSSRGSDRSCLDSE